MISGHRSLTRDLEVQIAMATTNKALKQALDKVKSSSCVPTGIISFDYHTQEREEMCSYCSELNLSQVTSEPSRRLSLWEWVATTLLKPHV